MKGSRLLRTAVIGVLIASLCVPATAMAARPAGKPAPGKKAGQGPVQGQTGGQALKEQKQEERQERKDAREERKLENLVKRVERILRLRKAKFDHAEAIIQRRIDRLGAIASRAESLGVDVTEARAALDKAKEELANAAAEEDEAVDLFKAVLTADDKRAAFAAARAQGRVAAKALQRARLQVVTALKLLHKAVDESQVWSPNATRTVSPEAPEAPEEQEEPTP